MYQQQMTNYWENYLFLKIEDHFKLTQSNHAKFLIDNWEKQKFLFWQIIPKEMINKFEKSVLIKDIISA